MGDLFFLYGFDDKVAEYLDGGTSSAETIGDHVLDRESLVMKFVKCELGSGIALPADCERAGPDIWAPLGLTYSGHRTDQPTSFLGCPAEFVLSQDLLDENSVRWEDGRTTIGWDNLAKDGVSPISFVAHRSHANKPAPGVYRVSVSGAPDAFVPDVLEPAGRLDGVLSRPKPVELDFSIPEHAMLSSSAFMIDAPPLKRGDARLPPYDGLYPPSQFASEEESNSTFEDCLTASGTLGAECRRCRAIGILGQPPSPDEGNTPPTEEVSLPLVLASTGDPHLFTLDGLVYDFQAIGEFVLVETGTGGLQVQARQARYPIPGSQVSMNTAFAFDLMSDRVSIVRETNDEVIVYVNGNILEESGLVPLPGGGTLQVMPQEWTLRWNDGSRARVTTRGPFLDLHLGLSIAYRGLVAGLLGNYDGDSSNDFFTRDGMELGSAPAASDLYGVYADSWRVTGESSLFYYKDGESTDLFTNRFFPRRVFRIEDLSEEDRLFAIAQCREAGVELLIDQCVLDFGATRDPAFLDSAAAAEELSAAQFVEVDVIGEIGPIDELKLEDLVGQYVGSVFDNIFDTGIGFPVEVELRLSSSGTLFGITTYPTLDCAGTIDSLIESPVGPSRKLFEASESLTTQGACIDGLSLFIITLTPADNPFATVIDLDSRIGLGIDYYSPAGGLEQVAVLEKIIR